MADKTTTVRPPDIDVRDARAFAIEPELAAEAYRRISDLQDAVGEMARHAAVLGRQVPLGGGYAKEIGEFMARYGVGGRGSAVDSLTRFGRELGELKEQIDTAVRRYRRTDDDAAAELDGVDCSGG
ncbi:hypothetical protein [Amycolatopsis suaedae]|uniref:ESX-1 secretion-associated protein n=1 Tax=Amycolatopsis suaedae TaxID=2510978 RepID=A0A4Q7IY37_9PSEU|nr:hypothetical protein [Amycolatopsis suaedae]RZQ59871.1 hypothetical protein EWH70_32695 [Amycolatopsis suaedae]